MKYFIVLLLTICSSYVFSDIYKYRDAQGRIFLFDKEVSRDNWTLIQRVGTTNKNTNPTNRNNVEKTPNKDVLLLQKKLASLGYETGPIDGMLGRKTVASIKQFQKDIGIQPDGIISSSLHTLLDAAIRLESNKISKKPSPQNKNNVTTGTGFIFTGHHILTNHHVIKNCKKILINSGSESETAMVEKSNLEEDIAILYTMKSWNSISEFSPNDSQLGQEVIVAGYPLRGLLSDDMNIVSGEISSLSGLQNDRSKFQITAPIQQGNSGGPMLDRNGNIIGMVVSKLNVIQVAKHTGDIPQNISFAIKGKVIKRFLKQTNIGYLTGTDKSVDLNTSEIANKAIQFTVPIECHQN